MNIQPVVRDTATAAFFDGTARGVFLLRRAVGSGEILAPSAEQDSAGDTDLEWVEASGLGRVVSWAFVPQRGTGSDTPLVLTIGVVELDEGPGGGPSSSASSATDVAEGLRVRAVFPKSGPAESGRVRPGLRARVRTCCSTGLGSADRPSPRGCTPCGNPFDAPRRSAHTCRTRTCTSSGPVATQWIRRRRPGPSSTTNGQGRPCPLPPSLRQTPLRDSCIRLVSMWAARRAHP